MRVISVRPDVPSGAPPTLKRVARRRWPLALVAVALLTPLVWWTTASYFSDTEDNAPNEFTTATVKLTDTDGGSALFAPAAAFPGSTGSRCIEVAYSGSGPASVQVTASGVTDPANVAPYLDLKIERGTGGSFGNCTGFAAQATEYDGTLAALVGTWSGSWTSSSSATATYRVTWTLNTTVPADRQSAPLSGTLEWKATP